MTKRLIWLLLFVSPAFAQINNGGSGSSSAGTGSCTNQVVTAVNANAIAPTCTTVTSAYVDSTVVTPSANQTLTNKNLTGASNGNSVNLLNFQPASTAVTGTGADAALFTYNMPGNTLGINKCVRITYAFQHATGTASVGFKIKFGATTVATTSSTAAALGYVTSIVCNNAATNVQAYLQAPAGTISTTNAAPTTGTAAIDTTASVAITGTMNVANTDTVTPQFFMVELVQ